MCFRGRFASIGGVKRFVLFLLMCTLVITTRTAWANAVLGGPLLITEVQAGSSVNNSEEFIELYNASDKPINLADRQWQVQIASSGALSWSKPYRTIHLTGTVAAHAYNVVASKKYMTSLSKATFSAGLSAVGGHIRLLYTASQTQADGTCASDLVVSDEVEWGGASLDARSTYKTDKKGLPAGKSLARAWSGAGYVDINNDAADFSLAVPTPKANNPIVSDSVATSPDLLADNCAVASSGDGQANPPIGQSTTGAIPSVDQGLLAPQLSELLPNPASPQIDTSDEFIELYNPNSVAFDLSAFVLHSGKHTFAFAAGTSLAPTAFAAYYSRDTKLSLPNSGGQVQLLDPLGSVIAQSDAYDLAPSGQSFVLANGMWQWSLTPTPNAANSINPPTAVVAKATPSSTVTKKTSVKGATTKAVAAPKTTKKAASAPASDSPPAATVQQKSGGFHPGVLAGAAVLAVLYGAYEYRRDVANWIGKRRANRDASRKIRQSLAGRRSD